MHIFFAALGSFLLTCYLLTVLVLGETVATVGLGSKEVLALGLVAFGLSFVSLRILLQRRLLSKSFLLGMGSASATLAMVLVIVDVVVFVLVPVSPAFGPAITPQPGSRSTQTDENSLLSDWYPRLYYPTEANFRLHKPSFQVRGRHFGSFYRPYMLDSPTLKSEVLSKNEVQISINALGFRERDSMASCRLFALGDSFTFGYQVTDTQIWPELAQSQIDECVYNLGISDASPKQELELLKYLLSDSTPALEIEHLIWMIYEGNDLEDSFADERPQFVGGESRAAIEGTVIDGVLDTLLALKTQSVIDRFRKGTLKFKTSQLADQFNYSIDGVEVPYPIVHSRTLGYLLLYPDYVRTALADAEYFENHRNKEALRQVFSEMRRLSTEQDFNVTVVMAPTSIALYAPYFSPLDVQPIPRHFATQVNALSRANRFEYIDLFDLMVPFAKSEMMYFRDDDHWNPRGHEIVADLLAKRIVPGQ